MWKSLPLGGGGEWPNSPALPIGHKVTYFVIEGKDPLFPPASFSTTALSFIFSNLACIQGRAEHYPIVHNFHYCLDYVTVPYTSLAYSKGLSNSALEDSGLGQSILS